mgnify:CR=1 FL=1
MYKHLFFLFSCIILLNACEKSKFTISEVELIVAPETIMAVDPEGSVERPFLQVKEVGENWEHWLLIFGINDFEYEEGYEYRLKVEKKVRRKEEMYLPSFEYTLIEIISKRSKE